jgi:membrane protein implicated in regulation of membrane protease activity
MNTALRCLGRIDRVTWLLIAAFVGLGGYLLWDRGGALLAALPSVLFWLIILACPLMHLVMHRHGRHGEHRENARPQKSNPTSQVRDKPRIGEEK